MMIENINKYDDTLLNTFTLVPVQNCPGGDTDVVVSAEVLTETKTAYT